MLCCEQSSSFCKRKYLGNITAFSMYCTNFSEPHTASHGVLYWPK